MSNEVLIGILVTVICTVVGFLQKRNVINIKPKTKTGKIDMSKSEYTIEKHKHEK